jgi:DNA polymerase (family X)
MDKHYVANLLEEIGVLLSLRNENPFKVRAYHNAARSIENLDEDLERVVEEKRLDELPGIGERIAKKITKLVKTGRLPYYERLKKSTPEGLLHLLTLPGLGPKKVKTLYDKLKIKTTDDLIKCCKTGKIAKLRGFGVKTQQNILNGIGKLKSYTKRVLWWKAAQIAEPIMEKLSHLKEIKQAEIAGSFRRKLETIGDLDIVASGSSSRPIMNWFTKQPWVEKVLSTGPTKSSVRLKGGMQADLRVVPPDQFAFALLYFTGSKEHNIEMRKRANERGWSLSEYGLERLEARRRKKLQPLPKKKLLTEEAIFNALGLAYIPPELRENMGEIKAAEKNKLPSLVEEKELRGVFHCHTTESDGHHTLEEMIAGAEEMRWEYIGIADHSKSSFQANGMDEERLFSQVKRIRRLNQSKKYAIHVFAGLECDILTHGELDFPNEVLKELDYVIVSIHRSFNLDEKKMTARLIKAIENPYTTMVGHVTGRLLLRRDPYAINLTKIIDACIANGKVMELNAHPMRLDMDWRFWHQASQKGLRCSINPDAHRIGDLQYYLAGINIARKGWLEKKDVINTYTLAQMTKFLKPAKNA